MPGTTTAAPARRERRRATDRLAQRECRKRHKEHGDFIEGERKTSASGSNASGFSGFYSIRNDLPSTYTGLAKAQLISPVVASHACTYLATTCLRMS
ncbi:uncharacterized protein L3040_006982 [Drepanopeziza brunnea f. sp. 'multigermtubi']|uniref:uncharacterized protein n=1 Tax=Drepanopeziza brunnea f. sp. 'multigermtubi' TaxID=698441 RepID=UPI0023941258|nr:hypothetical protein L3040_006982 [Drepanopeziza brunnea f. sp. 'multigermtubi']